MGEGAYQSLIRQLATFHLTVTRPSLNKYLLVSINLTERPSIFKTKTFKGLQIPIYFTMKRYLAQENVNTSSFVYNMGRGGGERVPIRNFTLDKGVTL